MTHLLLVAAVDMALLDPPALTNGTLDVMAVWRVVIVSCVMAVWRVVVV